MICVCLSKKYVYLNLITPYCYWSPDDDDGHQQPAQLLLAGRSTAPVAASWIAAGWWAGQGRMGTKGTIIGGGGGPMEAGTGGLRLQPTTDMACTWFCSDLT